jgi:hypothetical protein
MARPTKVVLLGRLKTGGREFVPVKISPARFTPVEGASAYYLRFWRDDRRRVVPIPNATSVESGEIVVNIARIREAYTQAHLDLGIPIPAHNKRLVKESIYFIRAAESRRLKIGIARNVQERLNTLQTGSPEPLAIEASFEIDGCITEKQLHAIFKDCHIRREWFESTPPLEALIANIKNGSHTWFANVAESD